jgi:hypothetical protein
LIEQLREEWSYHLGHRMNWLVTGLGVLMIGSLSVLLFKSYLFAEFDPLIQLLDSSPMVSEASGPDLLYHHVALLNLRLFQFITVILLLLLTLPVSTDPSDGPSVPRDLSPVEAGIHHDIGVLGSLVIFITLTGLPALFNLFYAGVSVGPYFIGGLLFVLKLIVLYAMIRFWKELVRPSLAVLVSLLWFIGAHFRGLFTSGFDYLGPLTPPFSWLTTAIFPPFNRLNRSILSHYQGRTGLFLLDVLHFTVILCFLVGFTYGYLMRQKHD